MPDRPDITALVGWRKIPTYLLTETLPAGETKAENVTTHRSLPLGGEGPNKLL